MLENKKELYHQLHQLDPQHPDCYQLDAQVLDSMQLRRWLLSQGAGLQVLGPPRLREWMATIVREQAQQYAD